MPTKKKPTKRPGSSKSRAKLVKDKRANKKKAISNKYFKKKRVIRNIKKKPVKKNPARTAKDNKASKQITLHLGNKNVKFDVVEHRKVFTAYDLAQTLGTKLDDIAKTLLVEVELPELGKKKKGHYVVVLPASYRLNLAKVKKALKASKVGIATEKAMLKMGMEPGALTPFGSLRGMRVIVDKNLMKAQKILVGAESFVESLRLTTKDLVKSEEAIVCLIGDKSKLKLQKMVVPKRKPRKGKKSSAARAKPSRKARAGQRTISKRPAKRKAAPKKKAIRRRIAGKAPAKTKVRRR